MQDDARGSQSRSPRRISIAPMMDCTDRHFRYLLRLISRHAYLYTEMITTGALLHGDAPRFLAFDELEHPLALQLGGSDPAAMAACAAMAAQAGFDEVNINAGCPSDRVQSGRFGACLLTEPERVADCVARMRAAGPLPVTVKTRIGVDANDGPEVLARFVNTVAAAGCQTFIIHARKAWLQGLSPRQNREIPPLEYARVRHLKRACPHLEIILNGGLRTPAEVCEQLSHVDGVMLGRAVYANPYGLSAFESGEPAGTFPSRHEVIEAYLPYIETQLQQGQRLAAMTRHMVGLFNGLPGARAWRRYLSEHAHRAGADVEVVRRAAQCVPREAASLQRAG